jgi:fucokinase
VGRRYDAQSLTHMVLRVEQAMSTGGGWQDQVGGALPGFKVTRARPALPVVVHAEKIAVSAEATARFEQHAVLLNTGKSRLAKTLLQSVVRRWYHRTPEISRVVDELCVNAERMAGAVAEGSPERVGELLNAYWAQKKVMATDAEPPNISRLMAALQPLAHGMSLCGAGGGGFMLVLTKQPDAADTIRAALRHAGEAADGVTVHAVHVSAEGLQLRLDHE